MKRQYQKPTIMFPECRVDTILQHASSFTLEHRSYVRTSAAVAGIGN
jgi:hypothetical protein